MARRSFDVYRHADAPVHLVWDVLVDHERYSDWTALPASRLEREGQPDRNGVGSVRALGSGPTTSFEEVVEFDPPHHMAYVINSGPPVRGYRADVELMGTSDGGTDVRWVGSFESTPPGLTVPLRMVLEAAVTHLADRLVRESERRATV
jgi:uncharacterized protein YndB with AHSA1/START domain